MNTYNTYPNFSQPFCAYNQLDLIGKCITLKMIQLQDQIKVQSLGFFLKNRNFQFLF